MTDFMCFSIQINYCLINLQVYALFALYILTKYSPADKSEMSTQAPSHFDEASVTSVFTTAPCWLMISTLYLPSSTLFEMK